MIKKPFRTGFFFGHAALLYNLGTKVPKLKIQN